MLLKKLINSIILIPLISFIIVLGVFFVFFKIILQNIATEKLQQDKIELIKEKKQELKKEVDSLILSFSYLRKAVFENAYMFLESGFKTPSDSKIKFFDSINNDSAMLKSFIIKGKVFYLLETNNSSYLIKLLKEDNLVKAVGIDTREIEKTVKKSIFEFLDEYNKNKISYISVGKIDNWNPDKSGIIGELIYMPPKLRMLIGKKLSINISDVKGHKYRKEYFECLKAKRDDCFVSYMFLNPLTKRYERKISYFAIMKPYNWVFIKGMYETQILENFKKIENQVYANINILFKKAIILLVLITVIIVIISYFISKFIMNEIIRSYEQMRKKFLRKFFFDEITQLPNRAKLIEDINKGTYQGLILIDIDDFSDLNDIYGFNFGDEILNQVKKTLKNYYEKVYKIGSDEFAIPLKREVKKEDLIKLSNIKPSYDGVVINFTIGASNYKKRLLETAEIALKFAYKQQSKKYMFFDENIEYQQIKKVDKIQFLHKVLENRAIEPYFHCIVNENKEIVKYEALMRIVWEGVVYEPKDFMDLLKESKMYLKFSKIMLEKIFNYLPEINKTVSINLSFEDLNNYEIKKMIYENLKNKNYDVCFEILESESIKDFEVVKRFINNVKKFNAKVAIDDFGSGYSNFINIVQLSPDYLKIDSSIVKNIENEKFREIVKIIIQFAKKFNIQITAEYVCREKIFRILKEMGVDEYQGFYFCKPQPINRLKNDKIS